jgi:hypothetical protein
MSEATIQVGDLHALESNESVGQRQIEREQESGDGWSTSDPPSSNALMRRLYHSYAPARRAVSISYALARIF